jgi:predicted TPR repeat methyltransferase
MENLEPDMADRATFLRDRLLLSPNDSGTMCELALLLEERQELPQAIDLYQRALRVDPYQPDVALKLGRLWLALGDGARAASWFNRALSIDPDSAEAKTALDAVGDAESVTADYVRTLFDQYADRFDADLVGTLKYQAPRLVAGMLERHGVGNGAADILDLGCGTGLSGAALKPFACRLDGVDLSPRMVEKARARAFYDALSVGDVVAFLDGATAAWDLIAAVDVLNYLSDLGPVFLVSARRLRPGGLLAGTVEKREEGGVALSEKRRYRHGRDHLAAAIDAAGLVPVEIAEGELRREGGAGVAGLVFLAHRPD